MTKLITLFFIIVSLLTINIILKNNARRGDAIRLLWTLSALVFVLSMVSCPQIVFEGAALGLKTWWNIVFPALLPFFIASELLMSFGFVHFMGELLDPVMRPLFNVPGSGSFVMAVGFTSGYPIGSMVTARLRKEGLCSRVEAERLMSFTNNSSPLFMLAAVAVGMFNNPGLGVLIAGTHYLSNITLGLILRFYSLKEGGMPRQTSTGSRNPVVRALGRMMQVQRKEKRPPGKIIGDAISKSIANLLNIGGFIILFSVIIKLLSAAGIISSIAEILGFFLLPLGFSPDILPALSSGFLEMTIGSKLASEAPVPLSQQVIAVGMILAWSGISVHAQAASMIADTDIRMLPFILSRVGHTCLAGIYTYLACRWMGNLEVTTPTIAATHYFQNNSLAYLGFKTFLIFLLLLLAIMILSLLFHLLFSLRLLVIRK